MLRYIRYTVGFALLFSLSTSAGTKQVQPRLLVDFGDSATGELSLNQAEAETVEVDGSKWLEIRTESGANWPSVQIRPANMAWDLSMFYAVTADIRNPQTVPVRVLLSLNAEDADGQAQSSVSSITLAPGTTATLESPFGIWHGESRPIDPSHVTSIGIMLDRPGRAHRFFVDNIRAVPLGHSIVEELRGNEVFKKMKPILGRGVNFGNMLEAPRESDWGVRMEERYFDLVKTAGFTSVRIPVRWSAHAREQAPYTIDPEFFARVEWAVRQALAHRLHAVLNMHHYEELCSHPDRHRERYLELWIQIAERFKDYPDTLCFELLNEPHAELDVQKWNELLIEGLAVVRKTNPTRRIIVGPADWNDLDALQSLLLPDDDRNLVVTFHYYRPFQFTHQGANWVGDQARNWLGTTWTGTVAEQQSVVHDLDKVLAWAVHHRRPVYMGEFGAYGAAEMESRARWTRFVADQAVKRRMSFAYWEFCAGFGVYDPAADTWREPLKDALLP